MGSAYTPDIMTAFGLIDDRFNDADRNPESGTAPSSYTQGDAVAGLAVAQQSTPMVIRARGSQTDGGHLELRTLRAGHAGLGRAQIGWRDVAAGDTTSQYKGSEGLTLVTGWTTLVWNTTATLSDSRLHAITLKSGKVLVAGVSGVTATKTHTQYRYDPSDTSWTALTYTQANYQDQEGPCLVELPNGRVLMFLASGDDRNVDVVFTDDEGDTWTEYAWRVLPSSLSSGSSIDRLSAAYSNGEIVLFVSYQQSGTVQAAQYASDDLGGSFTASASGLRTDLGGDPTELQAVAQPDGGFVFVYADNDGASNITVYAHRIGSAYTSVADVAAVTVVGSIPTQAEHNLCIFRDDDETFWIVSDGGGAERRAQMWRSINGGGKWSQARGFGIATGDSANAKFKRFSVAVADGRGIMLTRWDASTATHDDQSVGVIYLGGYSSMTMPYEKSAASFTFDEQIAFTVQESINQYRGLLYLPIELPSVLTGTWTTAGAGTGDMTTSTGRYTITTSTQTLTHANTWTSTQVVAAVFEIEVTVPTGYGDDATDRVYANMIISDYDGTPGSASYTYDISVRLDDSGWALYDNNAGANVGTVATNLKVPAKIRVAIDSGGGVRSWYLLSPTHVRDWTEGPNSTSLTNTAADTPNTFKWGHGASNTDESRWGMVGACFWADKYGPSNAKRIGQSWTNPDDLTGRTLPTQYAGIYDGVRIRAISGPTRLGDQWDIKAVGTRPLSNLLPSDEPSPLAPYRTADETEHVFAWAMGADGKTRMGSHSLMLGVLDANVKTIYLESSSNGSAWTTRLTWDASDGTSSLRFTRDGDTATPEKGGSSHKAGRYIYDSDFIGGTFYDTSNTKRRRIRANTAGAWTDETARIPQLLLKGVDGTEATSGNCELWAPSGLAIVHDVDVTDQYWRIRIPAQTTADGYFQLGLIAPGWVEAAANPYSLGWSRIAQPQTDTFSLPNGDTRAVSRGPVIRQIDVSWSDGVYSAPTDIANPSPPYAVGNTDPLASRGEVLGQLSGLLRRIKGAATPIFWIGNMPTGSGSLMVLNRQQWLYGRLMSESLSQDNVSGTEGAGEFSRGGTMQIREIPTADTV